MRSILLALALILAPASAPAQPTAAPTTNSSAVIATGNTFQTLLPALTGFAQRRSLTIANNNASDSCWLFVGNGTPTKATSILLFAGGSYVRYFPYVPSDALQATCATTGSTIYVETQ